MMPGIWAVLVPVTPFPAAICAGELRTAERADLLAGLGEYYGELIVCHPQDPLRRCWPCARPEGPGVVVAAAPVAGCSRDDQPTPADAPPLLPSTRPRGAGHGQRGRPPNHPIGRVHCTPPSTSGKSADSNHGFFGAVPPRTQSYVSDLRLFVSQLVRNDDSAGHANIRVQVALSDTNPSRMLRCRRFAADR
jgi:hypothetical protein